MERLVRLKQEVLNGSDEDLTAFKQPVAGGLTMISVAVRGGRAFLPRREKKEAAHDWQPNIRVL